MAWEVKRNRFRLVPERGREYLARNLESGFPNARRWHWVRAEYLNDRGLSVDLHKVNAWEVDWANTQNGGGKYMARNKRGTTRISRTWHLVTAGYLRTVGINTPTYRKDTWEIDWSNRSGKQVWARNTASKMPSAHEWHYVDFHALQRAGIAWQPKRIRTGRWIDANGYVALTRRGMTEDDVLLAEKFGIFRGERKAFVKEHQLEAAKKYRRPINGFVVRHLNGIKSDNRHDNIVLGTTQENTMDHNRARLAAMFWREQYQRVSSGQEPISPELWPEWATANI